jgi:flagellar biosynthesis/type III secretory pathway M-ring protein FliF/YscJ
MANGLPDRKKIKVVYIVLGVFILSLLITSVISSKSKKQADNKESQSSKEVKLIEENKDNKDEINKAIQDQLSLVEKQKKRTKSDTLMRLLIKD